MQTIVQLFLQYLYLHCEDVINVLHMYNYCYKKKNLILEAGNFAIHHVSIWENFDKANGPEIWTKSVLEYSG